METGHIGIAIVVIAVAFIVYLLVRDRPKSDGAGLGKKLRDVISAARRK